MFFRWFWAALVVSPLRTPTPMYTNFQDFFLTKLFQSRKVWIEGPRIRTVKSTDCSGHGPCSVVVLMLNMYESPLIVVLQCRIIKHHKAWECLTWPAPKSSNHLKSSSVFELNKQSEEKLRQAKTILFAVSEQRFHCTACLLPISPGMHCSQRGVYLVLGAGVPGPRGGQCTWFQGIGVYLVPGGCTWSQGRGCTWSWGGGTWSWGMYMVLGGVPGPGGCTWSGGFIWSPGGVPGPGGGVWSQGVYLVPGGVPGPGGCTCPGTPPPMDRITDACENISPCPNFVAGGNYQLQNILSTLSFWKKLSPKMMRVDFYCKSDKLKSVYYAFQKQTESALDVVTSKLSKPISLKFNVTFSLCWN